MKSDKLPERRKVLKCKDLVLTASEQDEFHHEGEGICALRLVFLAGMVNFAAFNIISVNLE